MFPKTEAEVTISAAALRTRTVGEVSVALIPMPDGEQPVTAEGEYFYDACDKVGVESVQLRIPLRMALNLTSSAPIPVRVEVTEFLLAEILMYSPSLAAETETSIFVPGSLSAVQSVSLTSEAFVGGLRWTHVEPQGKGTLAVLGSVNLPFSCAYGASGLTPAEFAIGLKASVQAVKLDGSLGEIVERYFYQICLVNADGGSTCPPKQTGANVSDEERNFKVIAQ
ncbi:MAG: hypothetical protein COA78_00305 [Blastopirellula sp.]|nr:MAG: hypothetical protein COA78_00305 [Blastopirellula sp.]